MDNTGGIKWVWDDTFSIEDPVVSETEKEELIRLRAEIHRHRYLAKFWRDVFHERGDHYAGYVEYRERYKITEEVKEENRRLKAKLRAADLCREDWMRQAAQSEQALFLERQKAEVPSRFSLVGWLLASGLAGWVVAALWVGA